MNDTQSFHEIVFIIETLKDIPHKICVDLAKGGADILLIHSSENDNAVFSLKKDIETLGRICVVLEGDSEDSTFKEEIRSVIQAQFSNKTALFVRTQL